MLRDFTHTPNITLITDTLDQFDSEFSGQKYKLTLIEFQLLSPDSFIWRLLINRKVYYLYAEDYIPDLEHVHKAIASYAVAGTKLDFIKVKQPIAFDQAEPVTGAVIYKKPKKSSEIMKHAISSGYDFVFLCQSNENTTNVFFNT